MAVVVAVVRKVVVVVVGSVAASLQIVAKELVGLEAEYLVALDMLGFGKVVPWQKTWTNCRSLDPPWTEYCSNCYYYSTPFRPHHPHSSRPSEPATDPRINQFNIDSLPPNQSINQITHLNRNWTLNCCCRICTGHVRRLNLCLSEHLLLLRLLLLLSCRWKRRTRD